MTRLAPEPAGDADAVRVIIARSASTLAEQSARIEFRTDWELASRPGRPEQSSPGLARRLARRALRTGWARVAETVDVPNLRDAFAHQVSVGYLQPAAGQYLMNSAAYAEMRVGGQSFGGLPGAPLQRRHRHRTSRTQSNEPTGLLRLLQDVTDARYTGEETLRGTVCRSVSATAGPAEVAVWVDGEHVRKIQVGERAPGEKPGAAKKLTLELWDFGVPVDSLDWSRLPNFSTPG